MRVAVVLVLAMIAMPAAAWACASDTDCKGDRVCNAGVCTAPSAPAACTADKECPGDQICTAQRCTAAAAATSPPPAAGPALGAAITPPPSGVQVSFAPATNASYQVTVETAAGLRQCLAPCSVAVEPGPRRVQITGDASFSQVVEIPANGGAFTVEQARPSRKSLWLTMTLVGGGLTALGFWGYGEKNVVIGVVGLAGGGPVFLAGVMGLLTDRGQGRNAIRTRTAAARVRKPAIALDSWGVGPVVGGVAGGASFSF